jgi:glycosyltransferase involved in cell wall biosynthesis
VRFRGRFARDRLADVYSELDVLVVPSIWDENSPLVVSEAFAAGVPVVAADVTGLREVIAHGRDGLLVPPNDPGALAEVMARVACDGRLLAVLRSGIQPVRSAAEASAELVELYSEILARPRPTSTRARSR